MIQEHPQGILKLKKGRDKPLRNRHPWVFSGAINSIEGDPENGSLVDIVASNGEWLGRGYFNELSQIQGRVLSFDLDEAIDEAFWKRQIERAIYHREKLNLAPHTTAYRLVSAEADLLPGLVVDKYGDYLVVQCLTLGIDVRKEMLFDLLNSLLKPKGIVERSDVSVRRKEGLAQTADTVRGSAPSESFEYLENNLPFSVSLLKGQKTGSYLDQRDNRAIVCDPNLVNNATVLNTFSYTGGFAVYAAKQSAKQITNVDSSENALMLAEQNVLRIDATRTEDEYILGDAFEVLRYYRETERKFDVVILDPPKFVNSRSQIEAACRGYKDLNMLGMDLLNEGGVLATFSCSGLLSADLFQKVVFGASADTGKHVQIIKTLTQSPDHPVALTFPESAYLKGLLCRVW